MPRKKDTNQTTFDFHFHFSDDSVRNCSLQGGSQEELSDFDRGLRLTMRNVLDDLSKREINPMDRYAVAAAISRSLGRDISKTHLDQWVAMSAVQRRIHADSLKAFCEVTGDNRPLHYFVESFGFKALHPEEASLAEYGAKMALKRAIDNDLKGLQPTLDDPLLLERITQRAMGQEKK